MKTAAIIPVKTFSKAKTRLGLPADTVADLCQIMLEEVVSTVSGSPHIHGTVIVTREPEAVRIADAAGADVIPDQEAGVNEAVLLADAYMLEAGYDSSVVFPQDIPYITVQDIDLVMQYRILPDSAIVVPSRRFDGTNALVRTPTDLMGTHYDYDSYRMHMETARSKTSNAIALFATSIMCDIDNMEDIRFLAGRGEKPHITDSILAILRGAAE